MTLPSSVRTALVAWVATLLVSTTIAPLVQGLAWFVDVAVLAGLTAGAGLAVRRVTASPLVVVAVQVVTWVVAMCMLFLSRSAWLGVLPGPDALAAGNDLVAEGLRVMRRNAAAVPATAGILFVTAGGLSLVALLVDVLAVTVRRPAVAGLPLLAVYCVPAAVLSDGLGWPLFLLAGVGFLLLVAVDSVDRVQAWGRVLSGADPSSGSLSGTVFGGARRLAGVSLALAVVVPVLVPGLGERLLTSGGSGPGKGNGTVTVLNPLLDLRANLGSRSTESIISYTTTMKNPQPLRVVVDDEFRGDLWQPSAGELPRDNKVQDGAGLPQGLDASVRHVDERTSISVSGLAQNYLPLPFPWTRIDVQGNWIFDAGSQVVVGEGVTTRNLSYTVDHYTVDATPSQLRAARPPDRAIAERYTALPGDLPPEIRQIAAQHAGNGTPYDQAVRLRDWLRSFTYSEQAPGDGATDSGSASVLQFLRLQRGYCVHFASGMAVMARTLGIPARVVVGFLPGTPNAQRTSWSVSLRDAHAWPELYFQGFGWVRFEPTPPAHTAGVPDVVSNGAQQEGQTRPSEAATPSVSASAPSPSATSRLDRDDQLAKKAAAGPAQVSGWGRVAAALRSPWALAVAVLLFALSLPAVAIALARRGRWRRATTRQQRAEAALDELAERLADLGLPVSAASTPRGLRQWLVGSEHVAPDRAAPLDRLVGEVEAARYAPPGGDGPGPDRLRRDVRAVAATVAEQVPARRRRLARFLPASGIAVLSGAARQQEAAGEGLARRGDGEPHRRLTGTGRRR